MEPIVVVLALLALGVAMAAWAVRRTPSRPYAQRRDQDTAWNDPIPSAVTGPSPAESATTGTVDADDPFAHAPSPASVERQP